jgi:hypothetical protein
MLGGLAPAVHAARFDLAFEPPATPAALQADLTGFLAALTAGLSRAGCTLVGHVKGGVRVDDAVVAFSLTTLTDAPRWQGAFPNLVSQAVLTLNVIVFGVSGDVVAELVESAASAASGSLSAASGKSSQKAAPKAVVPPGNTSAALSHPGVAGASER